eukprot:gb/GECH01008909.1/.p1 GENE.gb/GECH01008909.1/~~gb/GECH01008909.1/.p1  ORF type:complete len:166 (+),score=9.20 gb/GECH01008909.1/:1-498(+)
MENIILLGLCFGKKPLFDVFLSAISRQLNNFNTFQYNGKKVKIKLICTVLDKPVKASVGNMKQFNGKEGCCFCLNTGFFEQNSGFVYPVKHQEEVLETSWNDLLFVAHRKSEVLHNEYPDANDTLGGVMHQNEAPKPLFLERTPFFFEFIYRCFDEMDNKQFEGI